MKTILALFSLIACIIPGVFSQERFEIELIGGRLFNKTHGNGLSAFGDGFSAGSGLSYNFSDETQMGLRVVYSEMPYVARSYYGVSPAATDNAASLFFHDEKASSFEVSAGLKIESKTSFPIRPFLFIRSGLYFTKMEKKVFPSYPPFDDIRPPSRTETSSTDGFGAIGAGFRFSLLSGLSLNMEGALHKFFSQNAVLVPFLITTSIAI